jgi:pyruvate/2-oxoacid:ferredoxin oxidoreductase alpha subunit
MKYLPQKFAVYFALAAFLITLAFNTPVIHQHAEFRSHEISKHSHDFATHASNDYALTQEHVAQTVSHLFDEAHESHYHAHPVNNYSIRGQLFSQTKSMSAQIDMPGNNLSALSNIQKISSHMYLAPELSGTIYSSKTTSGLSPPVSLS